VVCLFSSPDAKPFPFPFFFSREGIESLLPFECAFLLVREDAFLAPGRIRGQSLFFGAPYFLPRQAKTAPAANTPAPLPRLALLVRCGSTHRFFSLPERMLGISLSRSNPPHRYAFPSQETGSGESGPFSVRYDERSKRMKWGKRVSLVK